MFAWQQNKHCLDSLCLFCHGQYSALNPAFTQFHTFKCRICVMSCETCVTFTVRFRFVLPSPFSVTLDFSFVILRQIYALNKVMTELEQQQFEAFCKQMQAQPE